MGSIALLARELGHEVSGTDENVYPPMSTQLESAGIALTSGYTDDCVPDGTELVIVGNSNLPRGNPALEAVMASRVPYTSGAEWLSRYLLQDRWVIAIAGTHGKTTTTSMVAWILEYAGLNPGYLIGGVPANFSSSSRLGETPFFVIEADEYDTSYFDRRSKFLHYRPQTLVINNLEYDHADIFADLDAIKAQFHLLLRSVPGNGLVIAPASDDNVNDVLSQGVWTPVLPLGSAAHEAVLLAADGSQFDVKLDGNLVGQISWTLSGLHNVNNGLAAVAAARHAGVSPAVACEALSEFKGVKRRMEVIFESPQLVVYDDFAHHPTAIATTLAGLRQKVGNERIVVVIEPASHTMRKGTHADTLLQSISDADHVYWFEPANVGWDMTALITEQSSLHGELDALLTELQQESVQPAGPETRTHLVIMSNSAFGGLHRRLVDQLQQL